MKKYSSYVGLDVHANSISLAVVEADGSEVRSLGNVAHDIGALCKVLKKIGDLKTMKICYEAGPCGYALYWELTRLGTECVVIAPSLIPQKSGDKVKTDRKDAEKLARLLRAGELTEVWVPDRAHEALRNLVRAREACRRDRRRAQQRVEKLVLREGLRAPLITKGKRAGKGRVEAFGTRYMVWLETIKFEQLQHSKHSMTTRAKSSTTTRVLRGSRNKSKRPSRLRRRICASSRWHCKRCVAWHKRQQLLWQLRSEILAASASRRN